MEQNTELEKLAHMDQVALEKLQLNPKRILLHQTRIKQAFLKNTRQTIPIVEACTLENGGIIPWASLSVLNPNPELVQWQKTSLVTCIPAAGAASRFFQGAPKLLYQNSSTLPKALVATTQQGDTFLRLKLLEQCFLLPCAANILIVPDQKKDLFLDIITNEWLALRSFLKKKGHCLPFYPPWSIFEQGPSLSTLRFTLQGEPFLEKGVNYSPVAGGHGELVHLFSEFTVKFPKANCLHIRNVDNVIGTEPKNIQDMNKLSNVFHYFREVLEFLRALANQEENIDKTPKNPEVSKKLHGILIELLLFLPEKSKLILKQFLHGTLPQDTKFSHAHKILSELFHWPQEFLDFKTLCQRPLSVFGVVQKKEGDVGGGPVFAQIEKGRIVKLCLEMPHATSEDNDVYFSNTGRSTHFNPVLVFFEIRTNTQQAEAGGQKNLGKNVDFETLFDKHFWLLTKREHEGQNVCYHETVLYELLGNASNTNLLFVDVPRTLFRPHKFYKDSLGQDRRTYGFHEILEFQNTPETTAT